MSAATYTAGDRVTVAGAYPGQKQVAEVVSQDGARVVVRYLDTGAFRDVAATRVRLLTDEARS